MEAILLGLGSIVGTGVFVSFSLAASVAGPYVVVATLAASVLALCNALSSAELAANHPVSGGTYEYGYKYLNPHLGFVAGWLFLCAKSASAATAALGISNYLLSGLGKSSEYLHWWAVGMVALITLLVLGGIKRSSAVNAAIVLVTFSSLILFLIGAMPTAVQKAAENFRTPGVALGGLLEATALMFVAFTGYGRIATLGEEIREPRSNIPRAIVATLLISAGLYLCVSAVSVAAVGASTLQGERSPLQYVSSQLQMPFVALAVSGGALTAMLGVLLNLILGLSRVLLAMGRRNDMPSIVSRINAGQTTPYVAVLTTGLVVAGLVLIGEVKATWSFSAFTVLLYYALTNASALRLASKDKLYPRVVNWSGLLGCLFLAFWVETHYWMAGLLTILLGLALRGGLRALQTSAK